MFVLGRVGEYMEEEEEEEDTVTVKHRSRSLVDEAAVLVKAVWLMTAGRVRL